MDSDVIVIGSGPAGVSAAYELLASGRRVTMLEAGADPYATVGTRPDRVVASKSVSSRNTSPKLRTPTASRMLSDYHAAYAVQTDDARAFDEWLAPHHHELTADVLGNLGPADKAQGDDEDEDAALDERAVLQHCRANLEDFMVPKAVEFRQSLPKTDTGKISRRLAAATLEAAE